MKVLAWNIQHGGRSRLSQIGEKIAAYQPDVVALTEFRTRPGVYLCAALKERGLPHVQTTNPIGNQNGIAVFSRTTMERTRLCLAPTESRTRWLDLDLPEYGFGVGVYFTLWGRDRAILRVLQRHDFGTPCYRLRNHDCRNRSCSLGTGTRGRIGLTRTARPSNVRSTSDGSRRRVGRTCGGFTIRASLSTLGTRN